MKKFGTPIGAAPGCASEKVGLSSVGVPSIARPGTLSAAFFLAWRLSSETSFLLLRLPALNFLLPAGCPEPAWPEPPWLRLGAPGLSLPSGVGVALGFGLVPGTVGTAGTVGTGSGVPVGVGTAIGPLSMICAIAPVMPGTTICEAGVPGAMSTVLVMRWPVTRTTVTECNSAAAGSAATPRPTVATITAMITFRLFISSTRPPARCYASSRAFRRRGCDSSTRPRDVSHATEWLQVLQLENG